MHRFYLNPEWIPAVFLILSSSFPWSFLWLGFFERRCQRSIDAVECLDAVHIEEQFLPRLHQVNLVRSLGSIGNAEKTVVDTLLQGILVYNKDPRRVSAPAQEMPAQEI